MSSISNTYTSSGRDADKTTSNDKNCSSFELPFMSAQPSTLLNGNTPCVNPSLSYLNGLNYWSQKSFPNTEVHSFPTNTNFLPYLDDQQKLQQLQMQLLLMEQSGKEPQSVTKEHRIFGNKMEYLSGTNVNVPNHNILSGSQNMNFWNNLRMLPEMLAYTNPIIKETQNTSSGLSIQDIQQLAFLNQIYNQLNTGQSNSFNVNSISQSNTLVTDIPGINIPGNYHPTTISSQDVTLTDLSSKSNPSIHFTNNDNSILAGQIFNNFCNLQAENQKQRQNNIYFSDNISDTLKYSNPIPLNSTTSTNELYCSSGSVNPMILNTSVPASNNITSLNDKTSISSANSLAYAQALMMIMNAMYGSYKTGQTSVQNDQPNGLNLPQSGLFNYNTNQQSINSPTVTSTPLNTEPKESFNDVLTFLGQCLNSSTSYNDKTLSHRQQNTSVKQSQQVTNLSCSKSTTTKKLSGRQRTTSRNHQSDQPTTSTTTHRGRGRPPKLAGVQYQTQSKQQQHKRNQLTAHNDRQPQDNTEGNLAVVSDSISHCDQNCSQMKPEFIMSFSKPKGNAHGVTDMNDLNMFPGSMCFSESKIKIEPDSQEKKLLSTTTDRNESSVEETIDDVLKSIADCKGDLATLASQLAYSTLGITSNKQFCKDQTEVDNNDSYTNNPSLISHGQSSSHVPIHSEWNLQDVTKNVRQISMLGGVMFLNALGHDLCNQNNPQDKAPNTTGNYFNQSEFTETNLNNCASSTKCNLNTVVDSKVCLPQIGSQTEMKSICDTSYSFCPSEEKINSSIAPTYSSLTPTSSFMDPNQVKMFPYHVSQVHPKTDMCLNNTKNQEVPVQNQQLYQPTNEKTHHGLYNGTSENILKSTSLSSSDDNYSHLSSNTTNSLYQQNSAEKEYLKNFFIEFVKQQEQLQKEKDEFIKEEQKQLKEMPLPKLDSIPGNRMTRKMFGNCLMIIEFLHAFSDVLCIDPEIIPNMGELQSALIDRNPQCQRFLVHLVIGLLKLAVEDPGLPSPRLITQLLGQKFNEIELNEQTISIILRVFIISRNGYEDDMSDWLHPPIQFIDLTGEQQASLLAFICDELICSSRLISTEIDRTIEQQSLLKREKWIIESKIRRLRLLIAQKLTITGNLINNTITEYDRKAIDMEPTGYQKNMPLTTLPKLTSMPIVSNSCAISSTSLSDDEDSTCKISELEAKIESLTRKTEQKQREIDECSSRLSGLFLGQDRYYSNYYVLKHMGGIYIECESPGNMSTKSDCCVESLTTESGENPILPIDSTLSELPDSHLDHIVNQIKVRRELAQQRQLKLTVSIANSYPCHDIPFENKLHSNFEKLQLDGNSHAAILNQTEQCDINPETILNDVQLKNSDHLNGKDVIETVNENVCPRSPNCVHISHPDNEKIVENSDDPSCIKDSSGIYSNYDVKNISEDINCESLAQIPDNNPSELSTKKYPVIIVPKYPTESHSTQDDNISFQSLGSCIDDTNGPVGFVYNHISHKDDAEESTNQSKNDFEIKSNVSHDGICDSSMNPIPLNKVDGVECKEELKVKISTPLINHDNITKDTMINRDNVKLEDNNRQTNGQDCHDRLVNEISPYKLESFTYKTYTLGQPLDLSNKPLHSEPFSNENLNHETLPTEFKSDLDDLTLTKSVMLFMNHAGINLPTVDNQLYSDSWISIMNYCKFLLSSAISDEMVYSKSSNSDNVSLLNLPLKESIVKLREMMLNQFKTEPLNETQMINEQNNNHYQLDIDITECVNNELENRRIQTMKENLSCLKLKNDNIQSNWYELVDINKLKDLLDALNCRGVREKQLAKCIRRSKDFIELSMHVALKRNSDYDVVKSLPTTKLNSRLMQIRTHRRRGRRSGRGHGTTKMSSGFYYTGGGSWNCLSGKTSNGFISSSSWEGNNSSESKEIERLHSSTSNISRSDILCSSDDGSSDTNSGLTVTSLAGSKRTLVDMCRGYHNLSLTSTVNPIEIISSKYKIFDNKGLKWEDNSTEYENFMSECQLLYDVEALEDKIIYASLQTKEWKIPNKTSEDEIISLIPRTEVKKSRFEHWPLELARDRLLDIERHIERRYLLPPFNSEVHLNIIPEVETTDVPFLPEVRSNTESTDTGIETEGECNDIKYDRCEFNTEIVEDDINVSGQNHVPQIRHVTNKQSNSNDPVDTSNACDYQLDSNRPDGLNGPIHDQTSNNIPQDLMDWRTNLNQASDINTIRSCMNQLVLAIAWDKSIMKVKSRRKRKVYEDTDVNNNQMLKRSKMCSALKLEHPSMNSYDALSIVDSKFINPNRKYQGWWRKVHKYRKRTENIDSGTIPITKSKIRKYKPRSHTDLENKRRRPNASEEFNEFPLRKKPGRKPTYHLNTLPTKPKRHYHRRSILLVSKNISGSRGRPRRRCRTLHQEITNGNDDKSSTIDSTESIQPLCQTYQSMKSNELEWCRRATEDLLNHEASWAFRKPVNLKQVPIYRKIIKHPMDLSTIWRKVQDPAAYTTFSNWVHDVRLIFSNCEFFNEDDSEVGRAGHAMRAYFESRWSKFDEKVNLNGHEVDDESKSQKELIATNSVPERLIAICEDTTETKHLNTMSVQSTSGTEN
uniref:Bromodomain adjacent to zinc finger domain protein 2A n=1 Tax=Schistosoma haematobium TaxID=6185 RepID=A0A095C338_SCHHA